MPIKEHENGHEEDTLDGEQFSDEINPRNVKSSADSGLGSSDMVDESQHWRNGMKLFFI